MSDEGKKSKRMAFWSPDVNGEERRENRKIANVEFHSLQSAEVCHQYASFIANDEITST